MVRQCLVAAIMHKPEVEYLAFDEGGLIVIKDSEFIYGCGVRRGKV